MRGICEEKGEGRLGRSALDLIGTSAGKVRAEPCFQGFLELNRDTTPPLRRLTPVAF